VKPLRLARWEAWAPGLADPAAWRAWALQPRPLEGEGQPEAAFLPALQRRRCDALSRMMLEVAQRCSVDAGADALACVFASRHGSVGTLVSLLEDLARSEPPSPAKFSHSVHNTQAGLFSIFAGNRQPAMSVAAGADSFAHGFLEAAGALHCAGGCLVLLVVGDELLPAALAGLSDEQHPGYALALRLEPGEELELALAAGAERAAPAPPWPDALEFLRWWLSGEPELALAHPPREWRWRRVSAPARGRA
jgi:hypothetical protein